MNFNRRTFLKAASGASALPLLGHVRNVRAATSRVVVVGGGFAGATAAKYVALWGGPGVSVSLVEPDATHVSCILSNLVLNDRVKYSALGFNHSTLHQRYGVELVRDRAVAADPVAGKLDLASGSTLAFDRLIVAPGIGFDPVPGLSTPALQALVPHAWIAGSQTLTLRDQLMKMANGATVILTIPKAPYRCPPGPYERACVIADYLQRKKPRSKIIVLDANSGIQAEPAAFLNAFNVLYAGRLQYVPNAEVVRVSFEGNRRVAWVRNGGSEVAYRCDVLNHIPRNTAAPIVHQLGLANVGGRWAGVDPLSFESEVAPGIHVIGDAQGSGLPKAGHIANGEAKVCADAVVRLLNGWPIDEPARLSSLVLNSACYSPITYTTASWLNAVFAYDAGSGLMKRVDAAFGEAERHSTKNFEQMFKWAERLFDDTFA